MYRYIIVDDEPLIRKGVQKKIHSVGLGDKLACAGEAGNGVDGLKLIETVNPDIIITDMRMPEMDGKEFLKLIHERYPDKKIIVISGHSDFEYMREAISAKVVSYLLKPFNREEILSTLEHALRQLDEDREAAEQYVKKISEAEQLKAEADMRTLTNMLLGMYDSANPPPFTSEKLSLLSQARCFMLFTIYSPEPRQVTLNLDDRCLAIAHPHNKHMTFCLLFLTDTESDNDQSIRHQADSFAQGIGEQIPDSIIAISYAKNSLMQLHDAFNETIDVLNARCEKISPSIMFYNGDKAPSTQLDWPYMDELLFFIESGNVQKTTEYVNLLFDFFDSYAGVTLAELKNTCESIVLEVRNILFDVYHTIGNQKSSTSFDQYLDTYFDVESLRRYMTKVLPGIAELLSDHSSYSSQHVVDNIKTYINKNLNKTLSLEKVSSIFFLNPSYCSHLFKEKTGVNFIDYVNNARIDKAKDLLATTDEKVYKVAKSLGFDNTKYFFRLFKKLTGLTPEEYRQMVKQVK